MDPAIPDRFHGKSVRLGLILEVDLHIKKFRWPVAEWVQAVSGYR
jgi:hypothetical protein